MDDDSGRAGLRRLVDVINAREMEPFDTIYNDAVVIEWPQSGEVIRGKQISGSFASSVRRPSQPPRCTASSVRVTYGRRI
jgi:hypothetical protein